jgi:cytidyltransferase-like protein
MKRVLTIGTFDLFHEGHRNLLKACRELVGPDGQVIIGVNTDEFVEKYRGRPPIVPFESRASSLRAYGRVVGHANMTGRGPGDLIPTSDFIEQALPLTAHLDPDGHVYEDARYLAVGSDWARKAYYDQIGVDQGWLDSRHIILVYIPYTPGISSTLLRQGMCDVEEVRSELIDVPMRPSPTEPERRG